MAANKHCCGLDVQTHGMIIGIVGTIVGALACTISWKIFIPFPLAVFLLLTYIIILIGIGQKSVCSFIMAEIFLGFHIAFQAITVIFILCYGIWTTYISSWIYFNTGGEYQYDLPLREFHYWFEVFVVGLAVFVVLMLSGLIYSCIVVRRIRNLIEEENTPTPQYSMPQPIHINLYGVHIPPPLQQQIANAPSAPPQEYPQTHISMTSNVPPHIPHGYPIDASLYPSINSSYATSITSH